MYTVWKQELKAGEHLYSLPKDSRILSAAFQQGALQLWFLCDPYKAGKDDRQILVAGTGHEIPSHGDLKHIATALTEDQAFVFHIFERSHKYN